MAKYHKKIFLQVDPEGDKPEGDYYDSTEVTWCENRINETDLEYWSQEEVAKTLKAFADYAQKRMYENSNKDLSEFVNDFLII
jgi:cytochrome oxidase Cu insertion factor (SCO1/SenC/PrrC family)